MVTTDFLGALDAGSGLNSKNLVEALVTAERAPAESRLNKKITESQSEISAFGEEYAYGDTNDGVAKPMACI